MSGYIYGGVSRMTVPALRHALKRHGVTVVPGGRLLCDARRAELLAAVDEHNRSVAKAATVKVPAAT